MDGTMHSMRHGILPVRIDTSNDNDGVTGHAGLILVEETIKAVGLDPILTECLGARKRGHGFSPSENASSIILMMIAGGECVEDICILRSDKGLQKVLARSLPSPDVLLTFLHGFHDNDLIEQAKQQLPDDKVAYIPEENALLQNLGEAQIQLVHRLAALQPERAKQATLDHDATILESHKKEAKCHYKDGRGYQPAVVYWKEMDVVIADEFRDGNVPAAMRNVRLIEYSFDKLPCCVERRFFRADSACYTPEVLQLLSDPQRDIGFAISADMTTKLRGQCASVPNANWTMVADRPGEVVSCCEVDFRPNFWSKDAPRLRFIAIRIQSKQLNLDTRQPDTKYFAIVSNRWDLAADKLVDWHRQKAGTIERVFDVAKNELGAAVPPCGRFGANAAWLRLSMMAYNITSALRSLALNPTYQTARPKRLRYCILSVAAKVVVHARSVCLRIGRETEALAGIVEARVRLLRVRGIALA
jgi:Transposase DDE domain group 1